MIRKLQIKKTVIRSLTKREMELKGAARMSSSEWKNTEIYYNGGQCVVLQATQCFCPTGNCA